jgi:hypothetical protein
VFDEGRGWTWGKMVDDGTTPTYDDFIVNYVHYEGTGGEGSSTSPSVPHALPRTTRSSSSTLTAARTPTAAGTGVASRTPAGASTTSPTPASLLSASSASATALSASAAAPSDSDTQSSASATPLSASTTPLRVSATPPSASAAASAHGEHSLLNFVTPLSHDKDHIDAFHNSKPLRYRNMADILGA